MTKLELPGPAPPCSPKGGVAPGEAESTPATVNGTDGKQTNGEANNHNNGVANNKEAVKINNDDKPKQAAQEATAPSTNLKCLEDPNFSFDEVPSAPARAGPPQKTAHPADSQKLPEASTQAKKPSYRVLEDPAVDLPKPKPAGYKVLEDPMMTSIYEPARPEPAKGRPEEVADGARQQFDKFFKGNQN